MEGIPDSEIAAVNGASRLRHTNPRQGRTRGGSTGLLSPLSQETMAVEMNPPTSTNTGSLSARLRAIGLAAKLLAPFSLWRAAEGLFSKVFVVSIEMFKHNLKTFDNDVGRNS